MLMPLMLIGGTKIITAVPDPATKIGLEQRLPN